MAASNPYYAYYLQQIGSGDYYKSHITVQRGRGWLGNLFRSAWSYLRPLATSAAKHVGAEALHTSSNIVRDAMENPSLPLSEIAKLRGREGLNKLASRAPDILAGRGGRQRLKKRVKRQTLPRRRERRTVPKKQFPAIRDLFSPPSP